MNKGILEMIKESGTILEYPVRGGFDLKDLAKLIEYEITRPIPKQEYVLTNQEAETLPLEVLNWMGEHYKVLCSFEASEIVKKRKLENTKP